MLPSMSVISNAETVNIASMHVGMRAEILKEERPSLDQLRDHCVFTALVDSNERFDSPRCAESTRQTILQGLENWVNRDDSSASMFWLYGGAGAGKSALAQTLAERYKKLRRLAATFFFSKMAVPTRSDGNLLIPTLVFQLFEIFPDLRRFVEFQIAKDPILFYKSRETQWEALFVEPLISLAASDNPVQSDPLLVVVDGLDECQDPDVQCDLLRTIASSIPRLPFPFRFLIASRPESHIVRTFDYQNTLQAITVQRYDLSRDSNADHDIRSFLEQKFADVRRIHLLSAHLGFDWPSRDAVDTLVERSSGHFIYAATVMRYIECPRRRPDDRLQVILGLSTAAAQDTPYAPLDALYTRIFQELDDFQVETIRHVLGLLYLITEREGFFRFRTYSVTTVSLVNDLLGLKPGDLDLHFDSLRSLVALNARGDFHVFHKSLFDYLLDRSRSGSFCLQLKRAHETAAIYILKKCLLATCSLHNLYYFAYHCYFGRCDDVELKNYICSWDILYNSNFRQLLLGLALRDRASWLYPLFFILRTLRRQNKSVYEYHIEKILNLHSSIFRHQHSTWIPWTKMYKKAWSFLPAFYFLSKNDSASPCDPSQAQVLDEKLESIVKAWQPHNFIPGDTDPNFAIHREVFIRREHEVFASFMKSHDTCTENYVGRSTYACGEHSIYSYHFALCDKEEIGIMMFLTYERYGDGANCFAFNVPYDVNMYDEILKGIEEYLAEKAWIPWPKLAKHNQN